MVKKGWGDQHPALIPLLPCSIRCPHVAIRSFIGASSVRLNSGKTGLFPSKMGKKRGWKKRLAEKQEATKQFPVGHSAVDG